MSDLRLLLRYVYRQFHELLNRGTWYGTSGKWNDSGSIFREDQACKACRNGSNGNVKEGYPSERYYDKGCDLKCTDRRYGTGLLNKQHAPPSGDRTRGWI